MSAMSPNPVLLFRGVPWGLRAITGAFLQDCLVLRSARVRELQGIEKPYVPPERTKTLSRLFSSSQGRPKLSLYKSGNRLLSPTQPRKKNVGKRLSRRNKGN